MNHENRNKIKQCLNPVCVCVCDVFEFVQDEDDVIGSTTLDEARIQYGL